MEQLAIIQPGKCVYIEYMDIYDVSVEAAIDSIYGTVNWIIKLVARIILYLGITAGSIWKTNAALLLIPVNCLQLSLW